MSRRALALKTGDTAIDYLLAVAGVRPVHLRRAVRRTVDALDAVAPAKRRIKQGTDGSLEETIEDGGAPDWDARLRAAEQLYQLAGLRGQRRNPDAGDSSRPVNIAIVVNGANGHGNGHHVDAGSAADGIRIRVDGGHGNGSTHGPDGA
jgi:hypothetical protein